MGKILCSTGTMIGRPNKRNHKLLAEFAKQLDYDGFEFMMYDTWYEKVDELVDDLLKMNLFLPVMHCEKTIGETISKNEPGGLQQALKLFRVNCEVAKAIGAKKLVIHLWNGVTSDRYFDNNLNAYAGLAEIAEEFELMLLVENVICSQKDPMKHWCELRKRYPNISFIYDTKMAAFHNQSDLLYQDEYDWLWKEGHLRHFHVNDFGGTYMDFMNLKTLPVGAGTVDFDKFFQFVHKIHYDETFTVEATAFNQEGIVDIDMLNRCFTSLRNYLKED